ncbi:MAG TPA: phosphoribosylglycinamide formyltransferase [Longimicrobiales bacterium]
MSVRLAVFASGGGSNLQALLDRFADTPHVTPALVVSDRGDSGALRRATAAGVEALHIPVAGRSQQQLADDILTALDEWDIRLIALAGYLRLVPPAVVARYRGRIVNIHPALLPAFGGAGMYGRRVHEAVIDAGCRITGATVHYVDERYDEGRIIAQWPVPVLHDDTAETLAARVLRIEHLLYPAVVDIVARHLIDGAAGDAAASGEVFRLGTGDAGLAGDMMKLARI